MLSLEDIRKELGRDFLKRDDSIRYTYAEMLERFATNHFGRLPYINSLKGGQEKEEEVIEPENQCCEDYVIHDDDEQERTREERAKIDLKKTLDQVIKEYPDAIVYNYHEDRSDELALFHDEFIYYNESFYTNTPKLPERITKCVVYREDKPRFRWILRNSRGNIDTHFMDILPKGDIESNYNDDLIPVDQRINELIHKDESCIIILHGCPGTGKTSYIRNLISSNTDVKFYWIDSNMFAYLDSSEFITYLVTCKNAVFILEDSESLLKSREETKNPAMQSLLNISDGMLGDSLKLKFICTFNTNTRNIDQAILRKGRMKVKYEFKELCLEKVKKLFKKQGLDESLATKDMPLCDIYNFLEDNGNNTGRNKIGF